MGPLATPCHSPGKPARDPRYLAWIRTLPYAVCGGQAEAAHTGPHGMGQKASDYSATPLCWRDHRWEGGPGALHRGVKAFEMAHGIDIKALVRRLNSAWRLVNQNRTAA